MLIYKNDGTLYCISKKALKLAGYNDVAEFLDEHGDYSELFVKKPGYIYNFENFSWLSFLRNANPDQKKVLIATRDNATYESELEMEIVFPVEFGENTPEFFYQINFKNLHLASGTAADTSVAAGDFSEAGMAATIDLDRDLIAKEYEAFEGKGAATAEPIEETPLVFGEESSEPQPEPEPAPIVFDAPQSEESEAETAEEVLLFETSAETAGTAEPEPPKTAATEEALDLVDFTFDEEASAGQNEPPREKEREETFAFDDNALENAFAELGGTFAPKAPETVSVKEEPAEEAEPSIFEESPEPAETPTAEEKSAEKEPADTTASPSYEMPDLRKAAATLGLPETMVKAFVREFVDTYFEDIHEVKMAMDSDHIAVVKKEAMKLKGIAANLLMEPMVESLESVLTAKKDAEVRTIWEGIDGYVRALAEAYAPESLKAAEAPTALRMIVPVEAPAAAEPSPQSPVQKPSETPGVAEAVVPVLEEAGAGETIEFDPNEAANALGLPESLIIEFVNDFVTQAREEKETFLDAFGKGDLKTVNEVAHKLKGVAANLRIEDMRALMEEAQHADSLEEAKGPVERFYRKLGALGNTMAKEFA